ncbi:archaetidylserine decarboxylase [Zobellella denitrificans]|uniref:Phosphatidylserine decarboxylase proenzyme n=1 Tax=Zobellella denitrificans TaxID=347534 RepID=A0A291HLF1_9GAMM|nr:archaetidylserine decarboxylase [Zobellella denitrificans]ATG73046.1 phosphatidylserine decarboxylase [Zobellella denitrificans]
MIDNLKILLQYLLPKHLISRLVGLLAAMEGGRLTQWLIRRFIQRYRVDMNEAQYPDPAHYLSFNDFFTRPLKDGVRPLVQGEELLAMPVDGAISQLAPIQQGRIIQAKGHDFSARALLGGDKALAEPFMGGDFATIYLAPRDYHRIHMPLDGVLRTMIYVPGELFSVNPLTAERVPELFARNERVVCIFDTAAGPMALVLVGATIVASIETVWAGTITPPVGKRVQRWDYEPATAPRLAKGEEMGRFKLGSTVVCLFAPGRVTLSDSLRPGTPTRMGTEFGRLNRG